jgi:hypothetical protein
MNVMKQKDLFLNLFFKITILFFLALIISCSPQSKESYLENYKEFISDIGNENNEYTEEELIEMDEEYEKYSVELYEQFQEDLTLQEKILLAKYSVQYNLFKLKEDSSVLMDLFNEKDYHKLKEQIKYYSDNEMDDDIKTLVKQADEIGIEASKALEDILKELKIDNEKNEQ